MTAPTRNKVALQTDDAVRIQWANGKNEIRLPGQNRFVGGTPCWYSEIGKDVDFDAACEAAGTPTLEIRHPRQGGPAQVVRHWAMGEEIRFFPVTSGPVAATVAASLSQRNHAATVEAGIGIRWGRGEGERSKLAVRGYLCLGATVYPHLVQIGTKSRMTDELLAALVDHTRVCEVADSLIDRGKHPDVVQLYELALPLGAGKEEAWGKGETTTVYPIASLHPPAPDLPYLRSLWRSEALVAAAIEDWPGVQAWASEFSFAQQEVAQYEDGL